MFFINNKSKSFERAAERYLRDDLPCGLKACDECRKYGKERVKINLKNQLKIVLKTFLVGREKLRHQFVDSFESRRHRRCIGLDSVLRHFRVGVVRVSL